MKTPGKDFNQNANNKLVPNSKQDLDDDDFEDEEEELVLPDDEDDAEVADFDVPLDDLDNFDDFDNDDEDDDETY